MTDSVDAILTNAFLAFLKARLAQRHAALRRHARRWSSDLDGHLAALSSALSHVVQPGVDRSSLFEDVVALVVEREDALCAEAMAVARSRSVGPLGRPVGAGDVEAFWKVVRQEAGTVIEVQRISRASGDQKH